MKKQKVYYAHCMAIYHTEEEKSDIETLKRMGFDVVNPNEDPHSDKAMTMRARGKSRSEIMDYFVDVVEECDGLAFRALDNMSISAGVGKEIRAMYKKGGFVIELPKYEKRNVLSVNETRGIVMAARNKGDRGNR